MVDTEMALTFSVRNNPGRFALLLGSGVSTEAEIPTGWAVVQDLIEQLAEMEDESIDSEPEEWYEEEFDEKPEYDELLKSVGRSKEDRRAILEDYFEPTTEERERGEKTPTSAHESIAWLVEKGYINVILTTNFDRLLEQAFSDRGLSHVVISGPEDAAGAEPLTHQDAVILKVNGDYRETNIKNIASELEEYEPEIQDLIDQVFEEYGLIVCGWSGKWDTALRDSLNRCKKHRYTTFWAHHGDLEDTAESLIEQRGGEPVQITGASSFFSELKEKVQALEDAESGAPLTSEVARERVKRYLPRKEHTIDLNDLLRKETASVCKEVFDGERFPVYSERFDGTTHDRLESYEGVIETLSVAVATCAYWEVDTENSAKKPISSSIQQLGSTPSPSSPFNPGLANLRRYPATYLMYVVGVASVAAENWGLVREILTDTRVTPHKPNAGYTESTEKPVVEALHPWKVGAELGGGRNNGEKLLRERMQSNIYPAVEEFLTDSDRYQEVFQEFEAIADLVLIHVRKQQDRDVRSMDSTYFGSQITSFREEIESAEADWAPLQAGLFESSPDIALELMDTLEEKLRWM